MAQVDWSLSVICQDVRSFRELSFSKNSCGATPEQVKYLYNSFFAILAGLRDLKIPQESECKLPATVTSDKGSSKKKVFRERELLEGWGFLHCASNVLK